jgi:hypothetical protein
MTIAPKGYAVLCKDAYNNPPAEKFLTLSGIEYQIVDHYSNPVTGYQGTAYQRVDTGEVVIASRGTETNRGVVQDGLTDLGMVATGLNVQMPDARAFVARVIKKVNDEAVAQHTAKPSITLTGHSLGGTLTEILAHEFGMQAVTFNAYGAVDLGYRVPEGGTQVTNYVRVTDVVSAASRHFGQVVELATPGDIAQLKQAGYDDNVTAQSLRNPLAALSFAAHGIDNFVPNAPDLNSDFSPENEARARAHGNAIGLYRADVHALRSNTLSLPWQLRQKQETATHLAGVAATAVLQGDFEVAGKVAELAARRTTENARHAWSTTTNTAVLGINAMDRVGEHVAGQIKEAASEVGSQLDHLGKAMGSEAVERVVRHVVGDVSHAFDQARDDLSSRLDRVIKAADEGDWASFHQDNQVLADKAPGRELFAHAKVMVDLQEQHASRQSAPLPAPRRLDDPVHPDHALYQQARRAVHRLDAEHHRIPDQRSDQLAAALVVAARRDGLSRINEISVHRDGEHVSAWEKAPPGADWFTQFQISTRHAAVPIVSSLNTSIAHSSLAWEQTMQQKQIEQAKQEIQRQQQPAHQRSHGMSR